MTTEQYQIGYEAGYSDGFDAGSAPAAGQITVPKQTFDAMREALEKLLELHTIEEKWENDIKSGPYPERMTATQCSAAYNKFSTEFPPAWEAALTAANAVSEQPKPVALQWVAEMIMSDCGCSANNDRLLERVIGRIEQYERANAPAHPQASEPAVKDSLTAQAGWKLVPVEPTPEMIAAIWAYKSDSLQDCYRALLAAAPEAP